MSAFFFAVLFILLLLLRLDLLFFFCFDSFLVGFFRVSLAVDVVAVVVVAAAAAVAVHALPSWFLSTPSGLTSVNFVFQGM